MPTSREAAAMAAVVGEDVGHVIGFLANGGDAAVRVDDYTLLARAAELGNLEMTRVLLKYKCSVNGTCGSDGDTPLILAVKNGFVDVAKLLISSPRCKLDVGNNDGVTALIAASSEGLVSVMRALLRRGAATEKETNSEGHTALTLAVANGNQEAVELLLLYGANVEHRTKSGMQPKDLAWDLTDSGPSSRKRAIVEALMQSEARRQECKNAIGVATDVINERYRILRILGSGSFGTVFIVRDLRDPEAEVKAVKTIPMPETVDSLEAVDEGLHEARLMTRIQHPGIVRIFEYFDANRNYCIVMEHCEMGDLSQWIRAIRQSRMKFPVNLVIHWFLQLLMALEYLHSNSILHRDLKPRNIFLKSDSTTRIGDFGLSRRLLNSADLASTFAGTLKYLSPEVLKKKPYDTKSDIWSFGCTLYELASLQSLFGGTSSAEVKEKIQQAPIPNLPKEYPKELSSLFRKSIMQRSCNSRSSAEELAASDCVRVELQRMLLQGIGADQRFVRDNRCRVFDDVDSSVEDNSLDRESDDDSDTMRGCPEQLEAAISSSIDCRDLPRIEGAEAIISHDQAESVADDIRLNLENKRRQGFPLDDVIELLNKILHESPAEKERQLKKLTDDMQTCELVEMMLVLDMSERIK